MNEFLLSISENGKYFMKDNNPFFWLGDTAWLLFRKCSREEAWQYLRNRKELGYNVIQVSLMHAHPKAVTDGGAFYKDEDLYSDEYWKLCDDIIEMAEELGLFMGLLPAWGSFVKNGVITTENASAYAMYLADRYRNRKNIIWIIGGDVRGDAGMDTFRLLATTLKNENPDRLMTFHPFGRTASSLWFHEDPWLDFNLFQSGHRRYDQRTLDEWDDNTSTEEYFGEDNWRYVERDHENAVSKPTLDAEPSYEGIPQGLHNGKEPYWEAWDVRRYAYWSVFQGAAGHTYGSNSVMQFFRSAELKGAFAVREDWQEALHSEGAGQMQHLKDLMCSVDFIHGRPREDLLLFGQRERYHRISVFAGEDYILCYVYSGDSFALDLSEYKDKKMDLYWMSPQSGAYSYIMSVSNQESIKLRPTRRMGDSCDCVLVCRTSIQGKKV